MVVVPLLLDCGPYIMMVPAGGTVGARCMRGCRVVWAVMVYRVSALTVVKFMSCVLRLLGASTVVTINRMVVSLHSECRMLWPMSVH